MLRLRTFGTATLESDAGALGAASTQRKRLATLALIAGGGDRGVTRDKLVAYLWPERDDRARHLLAQTLYSMRRELSGANGDDDLFLGTDPVRLNPKLISTDSTDFEEALAKGDLERAVELYSGPFLDGLHLDSEEFERWVDSMRSRLLGCQRDALATLARRAEKAANLPGAVVRWRQLAVLDPLDASAALSLMHALARAGNHAAAIQHARLYEELVRQELDAAPDARVGELARRLRMEEVKGEVPPTAAPRRSVPIVPSGEASRPARATPLRLPLGAAAVEAIPPARPSRSWRTRLRAAVPLIRRRSSVTAFGVLVIVASFWYAARPTARAQSLPGSGRIAVLPFAVHGGAAYAHLRTALVDLLGTSLDGMKDLRTVDARETLRIAADSAYDPRGGQSVARRVGAATFVLGDATVESGLLRLDVALYDAAPTAGSEPRLVARASAQGAADSVFRLVDSLTARLLVARDEPDAGFARIAADEPLVVLRDYLAGQRAFRDRRLTDATDAYRRAIARDSTFALSWYQLALVDSWLTDVDDARRAATRAVSLSARMPTRERALGIALLAYVDGRADEAERVYRQLAATNEQDVSAWRGLGEVLFHYNGQRGRPVTEARAAWEHVLASDGEDWGALLHLSEIAAREQRIAELDSLVARQTRGREGDPSLIPARALDAYARRDRAAQQQVLADVRRTTHLFPIVAAWDVSLDLGDLDGGAELLHALIEPKRQPEVLALVHVMQAQLSLSRGRVRRARAELAEADSLYSAFASRFAALALSTSFVPTTAEELVKARTRLARTIPEAHAPHVTTPSPWLDVHTGLDTLLDSYLSALLSLRLSDRATAEREANRLSAPNADDDARALARALAASIRLAVQGSEKAVTGKAAVAVADPAIPFGLSWSSPFYSLSLARFQRAQLLEAAGSDADALRLYASFVGSSLFDFVFAAPAHLASAHILERQGQPAAAALEYRAFIALWSQADPELQPAVKLAERSLAALRLDSMSAAPR